MVLGLTIACSDNATNVAGARSVTIKAADVRLTALGDSVRLASTVQGSSEALEWSTLTPSVATVNPDGWVRAVGNGTADIVARVRGGSLADTVTITVQQEAAAVAITPGADSLSTGAVKQFTAAATDRNGHGIAGATPAWSSSDTTVAAVTSEGVVTARRRGTARIRAQLRSAEGTADVVVLVSAFAAYRDTTLAGALEFASFHVAAGVTVSVSGDLHARIAGPLTVAGTLQGDCHVFELRADGDVDLRGTVRNACTQPNARPKSLIIVGDGEFNIEGAVIETSGDLAFGNDPAALATRLAAGRTSPAMAVAAAADFSAQAGRTPPSCNIKGGRLRVEPHGSRAASGAPKGEDGLPGGSVVHACSGNVRLIDTWMRGGDGQGGGDAASTAGAPGVGGRGGDGGTVVIFSHLMVKFEGGPLPNRIIAGEPGDGGNASGGPTTRVEAIGGDAGDAHFGSVDAAAIVVEAGGLSLEWKYDNARGGDAFARAADGMDAGAQPATPGDTAIAHGGRSANLGWRNPHTLVGDFLRAAILKGEQYIQLDIADPPRGGDAFVTGGKGGSGNEKFIHGADGGVMIGTGGTGGSLYFVDNRPTRSFNGFPGKGGNVIFSRGIAGNGWDDCVINEFTRGGNGGNSHAEGVAGEGGEFASGLRGLEGMIDAASSETGHAGFGGNGIPPGEAGRAKTSFVGDVSPRARSAFRDGMHGHECQYLVDLDTDVNPPDLHEGTLLFEKVFQGHVKLDPREPEQNTSSSMGSAAALNTEATFTIGPVTLKGILQDSLTFLATGSGTMSGRYGTAVLSGIMLTDSTGRFAGFTAEFTFGAGGELPGGQPQKYVVKARLHQNSPLPAAAQRRPPPRGR
jgi:hypothetical protein